jgi:hypothetical protein
MSTIETRQDLTGKKFGRLTILEGPWMGTGCMLLCRCDCGAEKWLVRRSVMSGATKSCGCLCKEVMVARRKHMYSGAAHLGAMQGISNNPTYKVWVAMLNRCDPKTSTNPGHRRYSGRGIVVCERWKDFSNFLNDMGDRPEGMSIDRIDNNGHYEPGNCRWATAKQQARNTSRNRWLTFNGETRVVVEWMDLSGIKRDKLMRMAKSGATTLELTCQ